MLKKLQYFGHIMGRTDSLEKSLMLGKLEGRMRLLDGIPNSRREFEPAPGSGHEEGNPVFCSPWAHRVGHKSVIDLDCAVTRTWAL